MDFQNVIYENIEKKKNSQQTYVYMWVTEILKFHEVLLCTYCKGLFCLKKQSSHLYSSVYA